MQSPPSNYFESDPSHTFSFGAKMVKCGLGLPGWIMGLGMGFGGGSGIGSCEVKLLRGGGGVLQVGYGGGGVTDG